MEKKYRKVAAVSGDARRALDICRRATEIAEFTESSNKSKNSNGAAIVSMVHVNQALSEMITSAKVTAIQNCSTMEKIFLQAVAAEVNFQYYSVLLELIFGNKYDKSFYIF